MREIFPIVRWVLVLAAGVAMLGVYSAQAQRNVPPVRKSLSELAAEVARTTKEYRVALGRSLPALEANLHEAADAVYERRNLHKLGLLSPTMSRKPSVHWRLLSRV